MSENRTIDNFVEVAKGFGLHALTAIRLMTPIEGQRCVLKRAERQSMCFKAGEIIAVTAYQIMAYTPVCIAYLYILTNNQN